MSRGTILIEGRVFQTSTNSRRPLQDYRFGVNADTAGVSSQDFTLGPNTTASIGNFNAFLHVCCTDVLRMSLTTVNPANIVNQTTVLNINRLFTITSAGVGLVLTNMSSTSVVEVRIIYS